jgi:hypothetical protein
VRESDYPKVEIRCIYLVTIVERSQFETRHDGPRLSAGLGSQEVRKPGSDLGHVLGREVQRYSGFIVSRERT